MQSFAPSGGYSLFFGGRTGWLSWLLLGCVVLGLTIVQKARIRATVVSTLVGAIAFSSAAVAQSPGEIGVAAAVNPQA